jgi:glycosyltransferase involved in cell wall biosynthesis
VPDVGRVPCGLVPKISIITPSLNHARFLPRTLESVRSQLATAEERFELEHIVVDGGSTDGTVELLRACGPEVRWVSGPDRGQADALNKGLAMATGDIIGWLNSDDVYEAGALSAVIEVMCAEPVTQWVYGRVRIVDENDHEIRRWITRYKDRRMRRFSFDKLLVENWISQMGVFWRRGASAEVGPFRSELHYCMDYDYWLRLGARWPGRFIDSRLAAFRWYRASKSGADFRQQFREELEVAQRQAAGHYRWPVFLHRLNLVKIITAYYLLRLLRR